MSEESRSPLNDEYHEHFMGRLTDLPLAKRIVYSLVADLSDRAGIGDEWDQIFTRDKEEILQTLITITERELAK